MSSLLIDAASASWIGTRSRQEDSVLTNIPQGDEPGLIVLSDGMGGHADGDIASRAIVTEVLADLFLAACRPDAMRVHGADILRHAAEAANIRLRDHTSAGVGQEGMGGTLVSGVIQDGSLRWLSVGDSPLYLMRGDALQRLNADHSLAPQIDLMVAQGEIDAESAKVHPQRGVLTSALTGGPIAKVDCPDEPMALHPGDIVVFASDGVDALGRTRISELLRDHRHRAASAIAERLIDAVERQGAQDQDNVSVVVVAVRPPPYERVERVAPTHPVPSWRLWAGNLLACLRPRGTQP